MTRKTRPIAWIKAARKDFEKFPSGARQDLARAPTIIAEGVHAFQKKSKSGISTPKAEIDLIRERIKRLKEALR